MGNKNVGKRCPNLRFVVDEDLEYEDYLCPAVICAGSVAQHNDEVFENLDVSDSLIDALKLILIIDSAERVIVEVHKAHRL